MCRQKHPPGKSQAGQTNILTPLRSRLLGKQSKCEVGIKSQGMTKGLEDLGRGNWIFRTMSSWEDYEDVRGRSWEMWLLADLVASLSTESHG